MELTQFYTWLSLLLSIISYSSAKTLYDPYDLDSYENGYDKRSYDNANANSYALTYGKPITTNHLDKLSAGYYYVDNGYIAPVPRSSASSNKRFLSSYNDDDVLSNGYRISPIVSYRKTRTKRKKLFVPNFFG